MQNFLDDVAKIITTSHQELDRVKIIVPSIRSITFLKEALKNEIDVPKIAPEIISVEDFIKELSGLERISNMDLLYTFFGVYFQNTPKEKQDSMEQFFNWAPTLIQEFNEMDSQLVDSNSLFDFMDAVGNIEKWDPKVKDNIKSRHLNFQNEIPKLYKLLFKELFNNQEGYAGMQLREAVRNLAFYTEQELPFHYFVGFNALSKAEETIIQELLATDRAEVLWDIDEQFFNDPFQGAGHFIRHYFSNWNALKSKKINSFSNSFSFEKQFEIFSIAKNTTQAKVAVQLATNLFETNPKESTVIALGDESLLHPILSSLPNNELPWNITMGYPLKSSQFANFFQKLFELLNSNSETGYPFFLVKEISKIAFIDTILEENGQSVNEVLRDFEKSNRLYIPIDTFTEGTGLKEILFSPFETVPLFLDRMQKLMEAIKKYYLNEEEDKLQEYNCERFVLIWEEILLMHSEKPYLSSLNEVKMVFEMLIQNQTLDFSGDALSKLQIMGILETRLLDFDNVIITHVNEGIIPFGKTSVSWIPFDVKKKFGMNTFIEQDHLYAYHFFRLLQRAKKVFLLYNANPEGLFSGEKSRFLVQLEYFKSPKHELTFRQVDLPFNNLIDSVKPAIKTKAVLEQLNEMAKEGFSPSSLTQYIRNPYLFYEQRMLKIKPLDTLELNLSAMDKGTIMHKVLEVLYLPFVNQSLSLNDFDQMLHKLPETLKDCFNDLYKNDDHRTGKNHIVFRVMEQILRSFILMERELVSQGNTLIIKALEHIFCKPLWVEKIKKEVVFKGTVDRIDSLNGVLRFVDYKTGNVEANDLAYYEMSEVTSDPKKSALFQVFLYSYVLKEEFSNQDCLAGVIPLKNYENSFLVTSKRITSKTKKTLLIDSKVHEAYENELFLLIEEIYDPSIPFIFKE
ncbi:MAG: PD-(D/E)XK nuclease family protein [Flavobacteriaceae bacterium]|nr:PD-(D/E)XK nuclease family protein [Flavobacteriaceae bacterium]